MVDLHGADRRAPGLVMLLVVRFLFGAGEAGALPNAARVLRAWFPDSSRASAGTCHPAMMLGGAAARVASQWLIDVVGWRWTFAVFAVLGVVWASRSTSGSATIRPKHPPTNAAELSIDCGGQ